MFSGDLFAPSMCMYLLIFESFLVSSYYKGEQMVAVFNKLHVDLACLGNHDFVR